MKELREKALQISGVKKGSSMSKGPGVETCQPVEVSVRKPNIADAQ